MKKMVRLALIVLVGFLIFVLVPISIQIYGNYQFEKSEIISATKHVRIVSVEHARNNLYRVKFVPLDGKRVFTFDPIIVAPKEILIRDIWLNVRSTRFIPPESVGRLVLIKDAGLFGARAEFAFIPEQKSSF